MITPVWDMPQHVEAFVSLGLWGDLRGVGPCRAVGFADADGLIGGVLFHDYDPDAGVIELTSYFARHDWLTKARLREVFSFPFDGIGARLAVARIAETNTRARRIWKALGAKETIIPEMHRPGEALCVFTLSSDDWHASQYMRTANG